MNLPGEASIAFMLLALAPLFQGISGIPLLLRKGSPGAQRLGVLLLVVGSLCGLTGAVLNLLAPHSERYVLSWGLPFGPGELGVDPLTALFLLPVCLVTGCSAVYGLGYHPAFRHGGRATKLAFFYGLLAASLVLLLLARNGVLFLIAWEVMALAAFFALTTDDDNPEVRDAGTLYLITAHLGSLALFALFSLLQHATGSQVFPASGTLSAQGALATAIFATGLIGFGLKAGVMPLHIWLPSAHANAPSHVSAVLSGVVLKTGIYGLVRVFSLFHAIPLWWGMTVLVLGVVSAILGVAFALGQHDLKRLLAYHSIENIGIIMMGLGLALVGMSRGNLPLVALGLAGGLLHVVNHAIFKALLFLAAGSVIHAAGTREIEVMGGVGRHQPKTAILFLVGAVAICGLPPLNGFVSELLVYVGSFSALHLDDLAGTVASLAAPALALVGGLAVACFVKVYGIVFLGMPRSPEHQALHESPASMLAPAAVLALCCVGIGLYPGGIAPALTAAGGVLATTATVPAVASIIPFSLVSLVAVLLLVLAASLFLWLYFRRVARQLPTATSVTWGCGYPRPTPRMQYSASSFADTLVSWFSPVLRPQVHKKGVQGIFPGPASYEGHVPETVLEKGYLPFLEYLYEKSTPLRHLQHGKLNIYIFYTFITLVVLMSLTMG
ncbi:proton-conducting transporter transmembrane domain-containing protein [Geomesophilobacter sediminis]|uniref:Hydrogenase n=1 Tax=Geomesophilobacter sediminis TaxID=2798584 RepID=A0A8J7M343_9BACT|nr:proton-conducting transporter membrane subunit [Geomesophilobacter sediminis]MBJ6727864.1 hydrogenase [Geomesophilobacter sediminis]